MSDTSENPMDKLAKLGQVLAQRAAEIGLELHQFVSIPDTTGQGAHVIQGVFSLVPEQAAVAADEDDEIAQALAGIWEATEANEKEANEQSALEKFRALQERIERKDGGLFDDGDS